MHYDKALSPRLPLADPFFRRTTRAGAIEVDDVKRILANIDAHRRNGRDLFLGHWWYSV
jgi:hypothetical protein